MLSSTRILWPSVRMVIDVRFFAFLGTLDAQHWHERCKRYLGFWKSFRNKLFMAMLKKGLQRSQFHCILFNIDARARQNWEFKVERNTFSSGTLKNIQRISECWIIAKDTENLAILLLQEQNRTCKILLVWISFCQAFYPWTWRSTSEEGDV